MKKNKNLSETTSIRIGPRRTPRRNDTLNWLRALSFYGRYMDEPWGGALWLDWDPWRRRGWGSSPRWVWSTAAPPPHSRSALHNRNNYVNRSNYRQFGGRKVQFLVRKLADTTKGSVPHLNPDPDPPDPHVFGPPGSFYHQAKKVRKTLIPTVCDFFWTFYLWKMM